MYRFGLQLYGLLSLLLFAGCGILAYRIALNRLTSGDQRHPHAPLQREEDPDDDPLS